MSQKLYERGCFLEVVRTGKETFYSVRKIDLYGKMYSLETVWNIIKIYP
jgi:hypothetical protein